MKLKKILIALILPFAFCVDMHADDDLQVYNMNINGVNYYIDDGRVVDQKNHRLSENEIQNLTQYGFDYETWNKIRTKRKISNACISYAIFVYGFFYSGLNESSQRWEYAIVATGLISTAAWLILGYQANRQFKLFMGAMNSNLSLGTTKNGVSLIYRF